MTPQEATVTPRPRPAIFTTRHTPGRRRQNAYTMPTSLSTALSTTLLVASLIWLLAGCGGRSEPVGGDASAWHAGPPFTVPSGARPDPAVDCNPTSGEPLPDGVIVFALTDPVSPDHAPVPHSLSETIVFRNLYETLVMADCTGELRPGLAGAWTSDASGLVWTFEIRPDARFWDGTPVTARAVLDAWTRNRALDRPAGRHSPWAWLDASIASAVAEDHRQLVVTLREAQPLLPYLLAHPACAVAKLQSGWRWPVGSGPGRLQSTTIEPLPDIVCHANLHHPDRPTWRRLTFRIVPQTDPRDLLALGANLLLVRHQLDVSYYEDVGEATLTPLPWDRLYLLLLTAPNARTDPQATGQRFRSAAAAVAASRDDLATAVAAESAWPADHASFTRPRGSICPELRAPAFVGASMPVAWDPTVRGIGDGTLLFRAADLDSRRLAERVAFLPPGFRSSVATPADEFDVHLQSGTAGGYIVSVPREYPTTCLTLAGILARAGWLAPEPFGISTAGTPDGDGDNALAAVLAQLGDRLVPLVYTRAYLVASGQLAGMVLAYDGTPLLGRAGWVESSPEAQP